MITSNSHNNVEFSFQEDSYSNESEILNEHDYAYSKNISNSSLITNFQSSNTVSFVGSYWSRKQEESLIKEFELFKVKFKNFLRFEDVPLEYVSPIEKELIKFLENGKEMTLNFIAQWIIDSFDDVKTLLNIVKILGNVAEEFLDNLFISNLCILLNHKDTEVKEYVLRIQEKVMSPVLHKLFMNAQYAPQWIDEYRAELVELYNEENSDLSLER